MANYLEVNASGQVAERSGTEVGGTAGQAGDIVQLDPAGRLDNSVLPVGVGADVSNLTAFETLAAGDYVNVFDDAGTPSVRLADRTNGRQADGFVVAAFVAATVAEVFHEGTNTGLLGLTSGQQLFLDVAGAAVTAAPAAVTGEILQALGAATSPTTAAFEASNPIVRA